MKTLTKLFLALGIALALTSCGGGGGDIFADDGYTDNGYNGNDYNDNGYNGNDYNGNGYNDNDYNGNYNNGGNYTNSGNYISLNNLAGRSISSSSGSYIDFCSDGSIYYYSNGNGNHTGTYSAVNGGYKLDFYDSDHGSYAIKTSNGLLEEGTTYQIKGIESFTIYSIGDSNC
jgi:hypothetical protein